MSFMAFDHPLFTTFHNGLWDTSGPLNRRQWSSQRLDQSFLSVATQSKKVPGLKLYPDMNHQAAVALMRPAAFTMHHCLSVFSPPVVVSLGDQNSDKGKANWRYHDVSQTWLLRIRVAKTDWNFCHCLCQRHQQSSTVAAAKETQANNHINRDRKHVMSPKLQFHSSDKKHGSLSERASNSISGAWQVIRGLNKWQ